MASTNPFDNPPPSDPHPEPESEPNRDPQPQLHHPPTSPTLAESTMPPPKTALQVDFSLKKWKVIISPISTSSSSPEPSDSALYRIDTQSTRRPQMLFRRANAPESSPPFGTGTLHTFSINPDYTLHNTSQPLTATKRFRTSYTYQSAIFSRVPGQTETMTWTSTSGFKNWDFILLDGDMLPVARYSSRVWAVRKWGKIEFLGERTEDERAREEIVVTGLVLFFCMVVRASSIFAFFGACFYRPGVNVKRSLEGGKGDVHVDVDGDGHGGRRE
ncbi:uncharacterized protein KD926_000690 [Aspergillus affinis]|uniref:uncharacterized protein n=1 Tax=Aspergillus affinis TaxID=1070780 RepID=UPI0022FDD4A2|nr:uncharacterized protein KD926_000690 [Aspergillus affinis]KAI9037253.1 hypothetical protein KD926_000690 [Aspergillus affinis]